jgi:hypothetical protein
LNFKVHGLDGFNSIVTIGTDVVENSPRASDFAIFAPQDPSSLNGSLFESRSIGIVYVTFPDVGMVVTVVIVVVVPPSGIVLN